MKKSLIAIYSMVTFSCLLTTAALLININNNNHKQKNSSSSSSEEVYDDGIYFICNGGKIKYSNYDSQFIDAYVAYGSVDRVNLESYDYIPYREGYTFEGWYTTSEFDDDTKVSGKINVAKETKFLYARYEEEDKPSMYQYTFSSNSGYVTINGFKNYDSSTPYNLKIPSYIAGRTVQYIDNSSEVPGFNVSNIFSVKLPEKLYYIYSNVFETTSIEEIFIPSTVSYIGYEAFAHCMNLKSISFADDCELKNISNRAFYGDISLKNVSIPSSVTSISDSAFAECSALESIEIPSTITSIGSDIISNTKYYNDQLESGSTYIKLGSSILYEYLGNDTSIVIPKEAIYLGANLYKNKTDITSFTFEEGTKCNVIGKSCFEGCTSLTSEFVLPSTITTINSSAFAGVTCDIDVSKCSFASNALSSSSFESYLGKKVKLPNTLTKISSYAFRNATNLVEVNLASTITTIESYAFSGCSYLPNVTLPESLIYIYSNAFANCISFTEINIPSKVTYIYSKAFYGCSNVTSITLSSALKNMSDSCFGLCSKVDNLVISSTLNKIGNKVFEGWKATSTITFENMTRDEVIAINTPTTEKIDGVEVEVNYLYGCNAIINYK